MNDETGQRVVEAMQAICDEIPNRLGITTIVKDAYERLLDATAGMDRQAAAMLVSAKLAEVLNEIATHAVEQFTRRTGEQFQWVDDPEPEPDDILMSFALDSKGNVVFGDGSK